MGRLLSVVLSIFEFLFPAKPGQSKDNPLKIVAAPGLMTLLDTALFRSNEGQLTATICSSHALLSCWLDVKRQSRLLLQELLEMEESAAKVLCESFARQCLEHSMDALERLSTDKLAQSANLSDPYDSISSVVGGHHGNLSSLSGVGAQGIVSGILESKEVTGRRQPIQRRRDCWESPRLYCPDYVWADDAYSACQRWVRTLCKHSWVLRDRDALAPLSSPSLSSPSSGSHHSTGSGSGGGGGSNYSGGGSGGGGGGGGGSSVLDSSRMPLSSKCYRQASLLVQLIQDDLPMRMYHFLQAMEADAVITKRLYLVKCEYRAPFRAFLEAHQSLLRAPPMELVDSYLQQKSPPSADKLKNDLQSLLKTPELIELLALERECEQIELDMGEALFPFSELARCLDHKKARLKVVPGVVTASELPNLQETVRRLKCILCRKGSSEASSGIRPLLLDLQLVPRDDGVQLSDTAKSLEERIDQFLSRCQCLSTLVKTRNAFRTVRGNENIDFSSSIFKGCTEQFDPELLRCQFLDWFTIVTRQRVVLSSTNLPEEIRQTEIQMSVAGAASQTRGQRSSTLPMVKDRLTKIVSDRQQRLEVLKEMAEELCLREMHLYVDVQGPPPDKALVLPETSSAVGFLGIPLQLAGESLPVG